MKRKFRFLLDAIFVSVFALLLVGCLATTNRSAKTLEPAQVSVGADYFHAIDVKNSSSDPLQFINAEARVGLFNGCDFGVQHTFDIIPDNDGAYSTIWGDLKFQLNNYSNELYKPIFSIGLMKGYIYDEQIKKHVTSIPLVLSSHFSSQTTGSFMYRPELLSSNFIPDEIKNNDRHTIALGIEHYFNEPNTTGWATKIEFSIGYFNSLYGGSGADAAAGMIFNVGARIESPVRYQSK